MTIAVLLATFNRKSKTLACLESLHNQQLPAGCTMEIILADDASRDGTAAAVEQRFPHVTVLRGTGSLFWAGGMRLCWEAARRRTPYDYYLLLNDDTLLYPGAIATLLGCPRPGIVIGTTVAPDGSISYGGRILTGALTGRQWSSRPIHSPIHYTDCDFGNANIMLIHQTVVRRMGILSPAYTHGLADYDYSLKAKRNGFAVISAPGFLGACTDDHGNNWMPQRTPLRDRLKYLHSPKGLAYKEYLHFIRDNFPLSWPSAFAKLWLKTLCPWLWTTLKRNA